jgi:hypothetical protein
VPEPEIKADFIGDSSGNIRDVRPKNVLKDTRPKGPKRWRKLLGHVTAIFFGLLLLGGGIFALVLGLSSITYQQQALAAWKPVQAQVISAGSGPLPQRPESGINRLGNGIADAIFGVDHAVWVSYRYQVDEREYVSGMHEPSHSDLNIREDINRLFKPWEYSGEKWSGQVSVPGGEKQAKGKEAWAKKTLAQFVPGSFCQAFYDPSDPSKSFLIKEYDFAPYQFSLIVLLPLLFGIILLTESFRGIRNKGPIADWRWIECFASIAFLGGSIWLLSHFWFNAEHPLARSWAPLGWLIFISIMGFFLGLFDWFFMKELRARAAGISASPWPAVLQTKTK